MSDIVLAARDAEDLEVISAKLQDAVTKIGDLSFVKKQRHFIGVFNRFRWENGGRTNTRVRSVLHFEGVLAVRCCNMRQGAPEAVVELLAVRFISNGADDPAGSVELTFAGGGILHLDVECLEAALADEGQEWAARGRPQHEDA